MEQILDTPQSTETKRMEYAGFWIRVAASVIDGVILTVAMWIVFFILGATLIGSAGGSDLDPDTAVAGVIGVYGIALIGVIMYFAVMESSERQATLGKMAVGIKVGDAYGNKISFANALGRTAAKWLSQAILYIGYLMVAWDDKKQGLHDKLASTFVFYGK